MDNVTVRIVADASAVRPGVDETKASLGGIEGIIAGIGGWVDNLVSKFAEMGSVGASAGAELASGMRAATAATEAEGNALTAMVMKVHEGAEAVRTFQMRAKEFAELYVAIFAAEGIAHFVEKMGEAAEKTVHLGQTLGLTIAQVQELQGVATGSGVSIDALTKGMLMMDNRAITTAGHTSTAAKAFQAMGISANDGRSNMERLLVLADKFHELPDGPTKAALAMQLMARGAGALIPVLDQGSAGIQALIDKTKEYGGVNEEAVERGEKLAKTVNESKLAWEGLKNTLMDALAPTLTAAAEGFNHLVQTMVQSYDAGGTVKRVFDAVTDAAHALGRIIGELAPVFQFLGQHIDAVMRVLEALAIVMAVRYATSIVIAIAQSQAVAAAIFAIEARAVGAATTMEALGLVSATAGRAMLAAFGGPVGLAILALTAGVYLLITATNEASEADAQYKQKLDEAKTSSDDLTTSLTDLAAAHGKAREKAEEEANAHLKNAEAKLKDAQASLVLAQSEASEANQRHAEEENATGPMVGMGSAGTSGMGFNPAAVAAAQAADKANANLKLAKQTAAEYQKQIADIQKAIATPPPSFDTGLDLTSPGKGKKPKDDAVQQLEDELQAKKNAWNEMQVAQDTAQEYSLQSEADFWKAALDRTDLSAKDKVKVEQKYIAAEMGLQKEAFDAKLELDKEAVERAGQNAALKLTAMKKEAADIAAFYGAQSKEAIAANKAVVQAEDGAAKQLREIHQQEAENSKQSQLAGLAAAEASAKFEVEMGRMSQGQLINLLRQYETQRYEIEATALQQRLKLMEKDPSISPLELTKLQGQIQQLWRQHQAKLTQIEQQAVAQRTQIERNGINSWASSWGSALGKLATLQAGFNTTLKSLWQGLQQAIGGVIEQLLTKFIAAEATKLIFGKTTAQAAIASEAAKAGAGGVASMAAAPWPIDMGAPAFGAAMSSAAMAFSGLNSAEGGAWNVQPGLFRLHANEMVLPAWAAEGVRGMITGQAPANFNAPAAGNDSGHAPGHTFIFNGPVNRAQLKRWFIDNHQAVGAGVHQFVRQLGNTSK